MKCVARKSLVARAPAVWRLPAAAEGPPPLPANVAAHQGSPRPEQAPARITWNPRGRRRLQGSLAYFVQFSRPNFGYDETPSWKLFKKMRGKHRGKI